VPLTAMSLYVGPVRWRKVTTSLRAARSRRDLRSALGGKIRCTKVYVGETSIAIEHGCFDG
jgi:hypothetical protein